MTPAAGEAQQPHRSQLHPRSLHIRRPPDDLALDLRRSRDPDDTREAAEAAKDRRGDAARKLAKGS